VAVANSGLSYCELHKEDCSLVAGNMCAGILARLDRACRAERRAFGLGGRGGARLDAGSGDSIRRAARKASRQTTNHERPTSNLMLGVNATTDSYRFNESRTGAEHWVGGNSGVCTTLE